MSKSCGACTLCCKLQGIEELNKPTNRWCKHACPGKVGAGCSIYATKPASCTDYKCLYLATDWIEDLRPDRCGAIFETTPATETQNIITMRVAPEKFDTAWRQPAMMNLLGKLMHANFHIAMTDGVRSRLFCVEKGPFAKPGAWGLYEGTFIRGDSPGADMIVGERIYRYDRKLLGGRLSEPGSISHYAHGGR